MALSSVLESSTSITPWGVGIGVTALLLSYWILFTFVTWYRLRAFPGPWLASVSYLWILRISTSGENGRRYHETCKKYGPITRIGPRELIVSDIDVIKRTTGARGSYQRSLWYRDTRSNPYLDSVFNILDTAVHDRHKAKLMVGYSGKENVCMESDLDGVVRELVACVRQRFATPPSSAAMLAPGNARFRPMDFATYASYFTLDVISKLAYGQSFGFLAHDTDVDGYLHGMRTAMPTVTAKGEVPPLGAFFGSALYLALFGPKKTDKQGFGILMKISHDVVKGRFVPGAKPKADMMGAFVRMGLTQEQCEREAIFQIIAGSDTTATALRHGLLHLLSSPRIYLALQQEIDASAPHLSTPPTVAEIDTTLPLLKAVVLETLRMHPPFTGAAFKQVPAGGDTLRGVFVPGGTRVAHDYIGTARSVAVFGPDADVFRPQRWLEANAAQRAAMRTTTELCFGNGRWQCAGKAVALMELHKALFELLRNFDFGLLNPESPIKSVNFNIYLESDMWVHVTDRLKPTSG